MAQKTSSQKSAYGYGSQERTPSKIARSWFILIAAILSGFSIAFCLHYRLPAPTHHDGYNPVTGLSDFSESNAMDIISHLSDRIGYRIVGTIEEKQTYDYIHDVLLKYQAEAQGKVGSPKFDIWVQQGTSSHRFDIVEKMVLKAYTNVTNIVVRLSCPIHPDHPENRSCEENAVLMNSHFDTTLGSPGATDDGSGIAVMMDLVRVLSKRDWTDYKNAIVFLFNGAEESLQDASHAFITMHEVKDSIRSVINIDSCGTSGREILFQANSREMIEAYKQAPYPHGTVMANDVFRTGLILSDTDFRQFVQYGNLTGIDMAIYKNSYLYHTHLDLTNYLESGAIQHLGANTLAIVNYLAQNATLTGIVPSSEVVFFDVQGLFFIVYSWATAYTIQMATVVLVSLYFTYIVYKTHTSSPYRSIQHILLSYTKSVLSIYLSMISAMVLPITVAMVLTSGGFDRHMAWFKHEWYGALIYSPMGLIGAYGIQYLSYFVPGPEHFDMEYGTLNSLMLMFAISTALATLTGVASSYIFWLYCSILWMTSVLNEWCLRPAASKIYLPQVGTGAYVASSFVLSLLYSDYAFALVDIFVPLTGRMGVDTPVDAIVAVIFGMIIFMISLPSVAHIHRFGRHVLKKLLTLLAILQVTVLVAVYIGGGHEGRWAFPYDELHPKRLFVQQLKNLTSGEITVNIAQLDHGPYIQTVVDRLEQELGVQAEVRHTDNMNDWDCVYPFSSFMSSHRFDVEPYIHQHAQLNSSLRPIDTLSGPFPEVKVVQDHYDPHTGVRSMSLVCLSPSYTWTVIAFDGHVVDWSIQDEAPLAEASRYVVRHVSGYGNDGWTLDVSLKVPEEDRDLAERGDWKVRFEFTALEEEGFAGKGEERKVGQVGILSIVRRSLPVWISPTWLSSVVQVWYL
ncbi:putative endoplasmic reticulum metallopeptidase 1 [Choanephora cucurbitarum]|uniref:Peptide hydrolase n=1 Tax=Choanephora cucurbitarum TaxID=101091 RepID=A0A1C7NBA2_9FUNG|nr:putative endoplasmic reticulum metallopeptidase 1 [Choanephora cucurbitarum]